MSQATLSIPKNSSITASMLAWVGTQCSRCRKTPQQAASVFGDSEFDSRKGTRRGQFLAKTEHVVPWQALLDLVKPHYQDPASGRRRLDLEMMLRIHLMQIWFGYGDLAGRSGKMYPIPSE